MIKKYGLTTVISGDTAGAAREIADAADPTQAAISPPLAAEIYGLDVLATDIEDEDHNTTRFVVLSREPKVAPAGNGPVVTSFIFNVRNLPAALYKALGGFATNGVNMTKLESYMVGGEFTATQFLAEVDGHPDDLPLKNALEELAFFTTDVTILGVHPADPSAHQAARDGVAAHRAGAVPRGGDAPRTHPCRASTGCWMAAEPEIGQVDLQRNGSAPVR